VCVCVCVYGGGDKCICFSKLKVRDMRTLQKSGCIPLSQGIYVVPMMFKVHMDYSDCIKRLAFATEPVFSML